MKKSLLLILLAVMVIAISTFTACSTISNLFGEQEYDGVIITKNMSTEYENPIYIWWNPGISSRFIAETAIDAFFEEYPEYNSNSIRVDTPGTQDRNALEAALASRSAPSMVRLNQLYVNQMGSNGFLENLTEDKYNVNQYEDKFIPSTWEAVKYKDAIYGIPFDVNTKVLMYNKDLLNEADTIVPTTYDEYVESTKAVKSLGLENTYGTAMSLYANTYDTTFSWLSLLWRMGGDVLNEDYTEATFNQQPGIDAFNIVLEGVKEQKISVSDNSGLTEFNSGNIAFIEADTTKMQTYFENDKFEINPMIVYKESVPNYSVMDLYSLAVISEEAGNNNTKMSYDFAVYLATDPIYAGQFSKMKRAIPSLIEASEDSYYESRIPKLFLDQVKNSKLRPSVSCWPQIEGIIRLAFNESNNGQRTVEDALNAAAETVNQLLADEIRNKEAVSVEQWNENRNWRDDYRDRGQWGDRRNNRRD